jgi:drug/metabolite transporter (DMT)-like permease
MNWRLQFMTLAAIWGSSFLFIKVLDARWSALWVAFGRVALGAVTLVVMVYARRERLPRDRQLWLDCAGLALIFNSLPWTLLAFGEDHTSSIVAGLWNATTPLWVLVLTLAGFGDERATPTRTVGLGLGFVGVGLLLGPWRGFGGGALIGYVACAAAAFCYGIGFHYTRRRLAWRSESGVVLSACQLICATALLAPFLTLTHLPGALRLQDVVSVIGLGALSSGVAFALNYGIVRARGATVASTVTYVVPVISTALGAAVLGEALHWNQPAGALVLLFGIAISQGRLTPRLAPARAARADSSASLPHPAPRTTSAHAAPASFSALDAGPSSRESRAHPPPAGGDSATTGPRRT